MYVVVSTGRSRRNRPDDKLEGTICKIGAFYKSAECQCVLVSFAAHVSGYERNREDCWLPGLLPTEEAGDVKSVGNEMTIRPRAKIVSFRFLDPI